MRLSVQRKSVYPEKEDNWQSIAARELPDMQGEAAVQSLQSWNLHVFMRPSAPGASDMNKHSILPSDIIFTEAPLAAP